MKQLPEILAPAGNLNCLKAAVASGADAVYFGGQAFNARRSAAGLTPEEIREAVQICRRQGVKTNLTLNTLVKEREWPDLLAYIDAVLPLGIDAVIVQDPGVAQAVHIRYPQVALHVSTQMAVQDLEGVLYLQSLGFQRIVLAREVTLEEIRRIHEQTDAELEVFIHGALCYSYSGRCLMSSFHGGRSGNRGGCAQPCRMAYQAGGQEKYFMNLKDLCAVSELSQLAEAGVASLKIEGRLKSEAYVAGITGFYRRLLDEYRDTGIMRSPTEEEWQQVCQLFNRGGFSNGYYEGKQHMIGQESPKHQGVSVGTVRQVSRGRVIIQSRLPLSSGDELEFRTGQPPYPSVRIAASMLKSPYEAALYMKESVHPGDAVWRVVDVALQKKLSEKAQQMPDTPVDLKFRARAGQRAELQAPAAPAVYGPVVQRASSRGLTKEAVQKQLIKTGGSGYRVQQLEIDIEDGLFLPVSALNQMRRELLEQLSKPPLRQAQERMLPIVKTARSGSRPDYWIGMESEEQWQEIAGRMSERVSALFPALEGFEKADPASFLRLAAGKRVVPSLPGIGRIAHREWTVQQMQRWMQLGVRDFEANLIGQVRLIESMGARPWAGPGLAVMNRTAAAFWQSRTESLMLSWELTGKEMARLGNPEGAYWMAYGRIPYMISEQCVYKEACGCQPSRDGHRIRLQDRKGEQMLVRSHCRLCYSDILSEKPLWLLDKTAPAMHTRLQFTVESAREAGQVLETLNTGIRPDFPVQTGHWDKGVE